MTDYKKLVAALRCCARAGADCRNNCPYYNNDVCIDDLKSDAAAAIEALIADVEKKESRITGLGNRIFALEQQLPKRGEWVFVAGDGKTCCDGWECSSCGKTYHTNVPYFGEFKYCPNCGAKMEVQDG